MSRIIQRQMLLGAPPEALRASWRASVEKEKLRQWMRAVESFSGVRILTGTIMTNRFRLLVEVPPRESVSIMPW